MSTNTLFVAFEGLDSAGKTRLIGDLLQTFSRVLPVHPSRELTTDIGRVTKSQISALDPIAKTLLFAADRQLRCRRDLPQGAAGALFLADRWIYSAFAYRVAEDDSLRDYVRDVNRVFPRPDVTFLVQISPAESLRRSALRGGHAYPLEFLRRVSDQYARLAVEFAMVIVDGMQDYTHLLAEVEDRIRIELGDTGIALTM
jgi:thymidylate kinase